MKLILFQVLKIFRTTVDVAIYVLLYALSNI